MRRKLTTLLAVFAAFTAMLVMAGASPASAASTLGDTGATGVAFHVCSGTHCVIGELETTIYPTGLGVDAVEFTCKVVATATASSTTVDGCSVGGVNAKVVPLSLPGSVVATAGQGFFAAGSSVTACISGYATFVESIFGPQNLPGSACGAVLVINV